MQVRNSLPMGNSTGEPYEGKPHVRFDEEGVVSVKINPKGPDRHHTFTLQIDSGLRERPRVNGAGSPPALAWAK